MGHFFCYFVVQVHVIELGRHAVYSILLEKKIGEEVIEAAQGKRNNIKYLWVAILKSVAISLGHPLTQVWKVLLFLEEGVE